MSLSVGGWRLVVCGLRFAVGGLSVCGLQLTVHAAITDNKIVCKGTSCKLVNTEKIVEKIDLLHSTPGAWVSEPPTANRKLPTANRTSYTTTFFFLFFISSYSLECFENV